MGKYTFGVFALQGRCNHVYYYYRYVGAIVLSSHEHFLYFIGVLIGTLVYARLEYMHDSAHAVFP